jgi:hypothetical protein
MILVIAGLVPVIHALAVQLERKTWMPGSSPGMTERAGYALLAMTIERGATASS